jgi:hypothetical protein
LVSYDHYLYLTDSDGTDRLLVEASDSGPGGPFVEVARHDTSGGLTWGSNTLSAADFTSAGLALTASAVLRFEANDGDTQSIVEAGLDAFRVVSITCGELGTRYCSSNGAQIAASGSTSLAADDLVLAASGLPAGKNGIFIYARDQQATPFASGTLCVGPSKIYRLQPLLKSSAGGTFTKAVDYGALNPGGLPQPGETWYFQAWFRANGSSDFTDGLALSFVPGAGSRASGALMPLAEPPQARARGKSASGVRPESGRALLNGVPWPGGPV